jgi:hypothetical protein
MLNGYGDPQQGLRPSYNLGVVTLGDGGRELLGNLEPVAKKGVLRFSELEGFSKFIERIEVDLADLLVERGT